MRRFVYVCVTCFAIWCVVTTAEGVDGLYPQVTLKPPIFPNAFNASFNEIITVYKQYRSSNNGTWYYDFTNRRARFDHNRGQTNNFCDNQGLSPEDPKGDCQLFFTPTEDLIVYYPGNKNCCRLCGKDEGCTILKPDWLQVDSKLIAVEEINGMTCYGWAKHGAVAAADTWFATADEIPCRYHEVVSVFHHNLTFVPETYRIGPQNPSIFDVPSYCNRTCPHPFPGQQ